MARVGRQPIWWIAAAIVLLAIYVIGVLDSLSNAPDASLIADMMLTLCVAIGTASYAVGYRLGSRYLWSALTIIYLAANGPYLLGVLFRLARATFNPAYQLRGSPSYYLFMIFMITFWIAATLRIAQSFHAQQRAETLKLQDIFGS